MVFELLDKDGHHCDFIQDFKVRWNTTSQMIERFIKLKKVVDKITRLDVEGVSVIFYDLTSKH